MKYKTTSTHWPSAIRHNPVCVRNHTRALCKNSHCYSSCMLGVQKQTIFMRYLPSCGTFFQILFRYRRICAHKMHWKNKIWLRPKRIGHTKNILLVIIKIIYFTIKAFSTAISSFDVSKIGKLHLAVNVNGHYDSIIN